MLDVQTVTKSFSKKEVVRGISFTVEKGEAFGLLGPNGAGKSTTISMICGLVPCDSGEVRIDGLSVSKHPMEAKKKVGIVPQDIALYPTMSARDNLIFWGSMYGLKRGEARRKAEEILQYVGLQERASDRIETFSGGMKRRINIGAALMHDPELLIMDEPTVGIDPQSRNHILEMIKSLNEKGMTVIYTSHYMEEVESLCKRIAIVDRGKLIAIGTKEDLCSRLVDGTVIALKLNKWNEAFLVRLKELPLVERLTIQQDENIINISVESKQAISDITACTIQYDLQVLALEVKEPNLETLFLQLTGRSLRD